MSLRIAPRASPSKPYVTVTRHTATRNQSADFSPPLFFSDGNPYVAVVSFLPGRNPVNVLPFGICLSEIPCQGCVFYFHSCTFFWLWLIFAPQVCLSPGFPRSPFQAWRFSRLVNSERTCHADLCLLIRKLGILFVASSSSKFLKLHTPLSLFTPFLLGVVTIYLLDVET